MAIFEKSPTTFCLTRGVTFTAPSFHFTHTGRGKMRGNGKQFWGKHNREVKTSVQQHSVSDERIPDLTRVNTSRTAGAIKPRT
ncbi:hypothetical protein CLCR_09357 [Cladophialophora carrionii]|uniref:Uncharacterized protein n=1 Tax=Cladophialophora carrionii TaxID=86049 RepID=A0A1C1CUN7_9EURO|nr:hypothetical protein CLCR_09357 [Cladophialophora carrionii]